MAPFTIVDKSKWVKCWYSHMQMLQIIVDFLCYRWDTSHERVPWVHTNTIGMKIHCFKLKQDTFVGHYFGCSKWGHFMADSATNSLSTTHDTTWRGNSRKRQGPQMLLRNCKR